MKRFARMVVIACLGLCCAGVVAAQEEHKPPKVLEITREFVKPGKGGATHEKAESLYIQVMARSKAPDHYIGMEAISGRTRALFFEGWDTFAAFEESRNAQAKEPGFMAGIQHADAVDGELLDSIDHTFWLYDEDGSYQSAVDVAKIRYFEIEHFEVRPGHEGEWIEAVKLVKTAISKATPDSHWAMYDMMYGMGSPSFIVITPRQSAAEIDKDLADNAKFVAAMGEDGMKRLGQLSASAVASQETNLFQVNPKMSTPLEAWVKEDPGFWGSKTAAAEGGAKKSAKPGEEKPKP
jgi:hypothetical protein